MTKQEIYDKLVAASLDDTFPSVGTYVYQTTDGKTENKLECKYRGEGKCRCGIGLFIKDKEYNPLMEGSTVENICGLLPGLLKSFPRGTTIRDLGTIQNAHDSTAMNRNETKSMPWSHEIFLDKINNLFYFRSVKKTKAR